jgi:SAM-dependent methyltransferase
MWQRQLVKRAIKSVLPFQSRLRQMKRKLLPYSDTQSNGLMALTAGLYQIGLLRRAGATLTGDVLELGAGWLPIVPLLFHIAGARRLIMTDIERLMDSGTIEQARRLIGDNLAAVADAFGEREADLRSRLGQPFSYRYLVPWSPSEIASGSVDIVVSRAVLEHIPPDQMETYLHEFRRILRPSGLMSHNVDNSDHWQHQDRSISRLNFLRYDGGLLWNFASALGYQNRMRHSDYLALFERTGWSPVIAEGEPDARCLDDLRALPLAPAFSGRDHRDLAILSSNFVLRRSTES